MKDTLKAAGRIGAELGAAKAENDRLRGLLEAALYYVPSNKSELRTLIDNALPKKAEPDCVACEGHPAARNNPCALCGKQAEPTDTYTAVDMATAAAQGFRDGKAAVEQAAAQDEKAAFEAAYHVVVDNGWTNVKHMARQVWDQARATRPAQAEQQPVGEMISNDGDIYWTDRHPPMGTRLYTAPIAQTAPQPEQSGLAEALEACRNELHYMIERHNKQSVADGSWLYDHQTVAEADAALAAYRAALSAQGGQ